MSAPEEIDASSEEFNNMLAINNNLTETLQI